MQIVTFNCSFQISQLESTALLEAKPSFYNKTTEDVISETSRKERWTPYAALIFTTYSLTDLKQLTPTACLGPSSFSSPGKKIIFELDLIKGVEYGLMFWPRHCLTYYWHARKHVFRGKSKMSLSTSLWGAWEKWGSRTVRNSPIDCKKQWKQGNTEDSAGGFGEKVIFNSHILLLNHYAAENWR